MKMASRILLAVGVGIVAVACSDNTTTPVNTSLAASALVTAPVSFDQINTSFVGSTDPSFGFSPDDEDGDIDSIQPPAHPDRRDESRGSNLC